MRDANGEWYPDPPTDPEARREWKTMYYARNYGTSREDILRIMNTPIPRRRNWRRIWLIAIFVSAALGICVRFCVTLR